MFRLACRGGCLAAAALLSTFVGVPSASAVVIDFDATAANPGGIDYGPGGPEEDELLDTFGDAPPVNVTYYSTNTLGTVGDVDGLHYSGVSYSGLSGVAYSDYTSTENFGVVSLKPTMAEIATLSFLAAVYDGGGNSGAQTTEIGFGNVTDGIYASFDIDPTLALGGPPLLISLSHPDFATVLASIDSDDEVILYFETNDGLVGIDQINYSLAAAAAVPEPSGWVAMLIIGAAMSIYAVRRKRR